ncbi:MAG: hypothetical protein ACTS22_02655 [Phycisphaerales bacterium]
MSRVGWLFSLVRSGSSAAAYAAAAPWSLGVADEPFGPWDRTGPPHNMPLIQRELARAFRAMGHTLTAEVVGMANELFRLLAERDTQGRGRVVCKCPHLLFAPDEFETWFRTSGAAGDTVTHQAVYLIRNPIRRLNSAYARGWEHVLNDPFELEIYRTFVDRWRRAATRLRYDELRRQPEAFFAELYRGLGFGGTAEDTARAAHYLAEHYHESSGATGPRDPSDPLSEREWATPREVLEVYLADEPLREFMHEQGWPTTRSAYESGLVRSVVRRLVAR